MAKLLSFSEVNALRETLNNGRDPYLQNWRTQAKFISPERFLEGTGQRNKGNKSTRDILRNTAGRSLRTFVAGMMNGATSRARPWFDLVLVNQSKRSTESDRYFAAVVKILNEHLQVSNFYRVLPMSYKDIGIFSNSAFAMLPHPRYGFYFVPFAVGTYSIGTDSEGMVNQFSRDFVLTVRQLVEQYGKLKANGHIDWSNFDPWIQMAWERSNYQMEVTCNTLILPNSDPRPDSLQPALKSMYQSYTSTRGVGANGINQVFETGTRYQNNSKGTSFDPERSEFVSVKGFDYFPVIANRWEVAPDGDWGVDGPGHIAVEDIKSLQETEKYRMEGVAKLVKPPMVGPASLRRHQSSILAGGITYLDEINEGTKFRPAFEVNPQLSELIACQADYEKAIKSAFFEDLFLMMAQEKSLSHVTAREIEERSAEKLMGIGPALGQLDQDQNGRVIRNAMHLLSKIPGKLPQAPKSIQGQQVRPEYISILAQAAKSSMIGSTDKLIQAVDMLAKVTQDPTLPKILKSDLIVRQYSDYLGTSPDLVRDEYEYGQIQKGVAEAQAQKMKMEQAQQASEVARNLGQSKVNLGEPGAGDMMNVRQQMQGQL